MLFNGSTQMFFAAVKHYLILTLTILKIHENSYLFYFLIFIVFARYLKNPIMTPIRGLLICFSCIFLLMLLLHKSTKFNFVKKSPTPKKISMKDENHIKDNTLTELEIDFTNISVLREVMIKG